MANLLYKNYNTGCYISWGTESAVPGDYCYGYASNLASYYADLKPNTTYTIQRIDNSARFRLGLTATDIKYLTATSGTTRSGIWAWGYRYDSSDPITFTTTDTATHLCVYYTNASEYTTRVMLNEGDTIQPYEAPTIPFGWYIDQDGHLTNSEFIDIPDKPFVGDSPLSMWHIDSNINNGMPYVPLMIDLPRRYGAFYNATSLSKITIPYSCKSIGEYAFTNTALKKVKIAPDCTYFPTSFPEGCVVEFYGGGGDYGQLYDGDNYAVIDGDGARVYVKE